MPNAERLVHYSTGPFQLEPLEYVQEPHFKPRGLWVSVDSCEHNWRWWCESEEFRLHALACAQEVILQPDANILRLTSAEDIDRFGEDYGLDFPNTSLFLLYIDWPRLAKCHAGIIIAPYIWERRLDGRMTWYYSWDCASGCIWDTKAIKELCNATTGA